jgi:hypothetical protein
VTGSCGEEEPEACRGEKSCAGEGAEDDDDVNDDDERDGKEGRVRRGASISIKTGSVETNRHQQQAVTKDRRRQTKQRIPE